MILVLLFIAITLQSKPKNHTLYVGLRPAPAHISRLRPTRPLREGVPNYGRLFPTAKLGQSM